jgi:hypothetical protein
MSKELKVPGILITQFTKNQMAKDPAFLFYPGDWSGGTLTMSRHLKGCYLDLLVAQFNAGPLSLEEIKTVLGNDFAVWGTLSKKFKKTETGLFFNERLEIEKIKRASYTESRRQSRQKADEDNVRIYLIQDSETKYTKIGSSVNPQRRLSEMINQKNPAVTVGSRDYTLIWFSDPVERKLEKEIHTFFLKNRIKGEWFNLSEKDIDMLLRTFFRTSPRTENGDINVNGNVNGFQSKKESFTKIDLFAALFDDELYVDDLNRTHKGKNFNQAFEECWMHWSNAKNPPDGLGEWKQKLNTWLINTKTNDRNNHKTSIRRADATVENGADFGKL